MGVQWFGHRQLQWRGLCKNSPKQFSEQATVEATTMAFRLQFHVELHPSCCIRAAQAATAAPSSLTLTLTLTRSATKLAASRLDPNLTRHSRTQNQHGHWPTAGGSGCRVAMQPAGKITSHAAIQTFSFDHLRHFTRCQTDQTCREPNLRACSS